MYTVKQENLYYRNLIINSNLKKKNNFLRVVKISSSRRIRKSSWHWGPEAPYQRWSLWAARAPSGVQGWHPVGGPGGETPMSKTDLRFSRLLKLALLSGRAILTREVSVFEWKSFTHFFFNFPFHDSLRCHVLVHVTSIYFYLHRTH